jgi:hypothetical protein
MTRRYIELGHPSDDPYTPYCLVEDLIAGKLQYDSPKKIPRITSQALSHKLVKGYPERERAVKWAAAFPNEGIPRPLQEKLGLGPAFDDLAQSALGDLIISVGDVQQRGFTLRGLDQLVVETDWLTTTIREFWRTYYETADITRGRAMDAFLHLLTTRVFPEGQWSVTERIAGGLTRNAGMILEGAFNGFVRRFPERRIHVRVLWEDEPIRDAAPSGEAVIQFRLLRFLDWPEEKRRRHADPLRLDLENRLIELNMNLMHRKENAISPLLERVVGPIVSPYKLTPLLLLTMHQMIEEKRKQDLIPKQDNQQIEFGFQPDLIDNVFRVLFDSQVGATVGAAEERIVEVALLQLLEGAYPDYDTLIRVTNWSSSLQKYSNALKHLETPHERQGQIIFESTKDEVAELFTLTNTGLDAFISNFPSLIEVEGGFPSRSEAKHGIRGAVRFKLHSLEQKIRHWLQDSPDTERVVTGGRSYDIHRVLSNELYRRADELGYREKEVDEILDLMEERGLIEKDTRRGIVREAISQAPSVDELAAEVETWHSTIECLYETFSRSTQLVQWREESEKTRQFVDQKLRTKPDDELLIGLRRSVKAYQAQLDAFITERHRDLRQETSNLLSRLPSLNRRQGETLEASIQGSVDYVQQVNDLRTRVLRQYTALAGELDRHRSSIESIRVSANVNELSPESLCRLTNQLQEKEIRTQELRQRCDELSDRFNEFAAWTDLVARGSQLLEEIQTLGELVQEQGIQFRQLSQEINGHLSANKLAALPDAPTYGVHLNEISESARQLKADAIGRFQSLQERYQNELAGVLGFPRDQLWRPHQYNPVAPDDTYSRLFDEVQHAVQSVFDRLHSTIVKEGESLQSTLQSPLLATLPDEKRKSILNTGNEIKQTLKIMNRQLESSWIELDSPGMVVQDFPKEGDGQFQKLLQQLGRVRDSITVIHPKVESLNSVLQALELSGPEDLLLRNIPSEAGAMEATELRQSIRHLGDNDFWDALRGLHAKRRLRVIIEAVRYD